MFDQVTDNWFQAAVAASRDVDRDGTYRISSDFGEADPQKDPRLRKILEGVLFSRKLVLTYHATVFAVVLLFTIAHWVAKWRRVRRRRPDVLVNSIKRYKPESGEEQVTRAQGSLFNSDANTPQMDRDESSSSGSSTLEGSASPPQKSRAVEEYIPLLATSRAKQPRRTPFSYLKASMMYQPSPIPIVNKSLPSNATSLFTSGLIGLNIFYLFYGCPITIRTLFIFADRASVLFVANLPLLYFLAAKNQPLKWLTGYSYESLNILHRRLGEILSLLALLHSAGMVGVWYTILRPAGWSLVYFLTRKIILLGLFAFVSYELLYFTSLGSIRQRWYELFLAVHVVLQAAALVLLWFHHPRSRIYVGFALAIFVVDRLVFRLALKTRHMTASLAIMDDQETVKLSAKWQLLSRRSWWRRVTGLGCSYKNGWKPTEHVFLTVPSLSRKHIIQAHPFTVASAAPSMFDHQAKLDLIIRAQDGFSRDLVEYARHTSDVKVRLDGPYGSQHALELLIDSKIAVIVAGGSGIAVAYPLVKGLLAHSCDDDDLDYEGFGCNKQKICLIWIIHEQSHSSWLGDQAFDSLREQGVDILIPPPTAESGRPDVGQLVKAWIHSRVEESRDSIGVVCSGPDGMNRAVRNSCAAMAAQGRNIDVEIEKFGW